MVFTRNYKMVIQLAGGKKFGFNSPSDFMDKLEWEYEQVMKAGFQTGREISYHFMNFAITGWHMADWTFPHLPIGFRSQFHKVGDFAHWAKKQNRMVAACRVIANSSKHFKERNEDEPSIEILAMPSWDEIHSNIPVRMSIAITIDGAIYELDEFARATISFWQNFLQHQGLLEN